MSKQKFQIGDNVYVKRGRKDEIGRVGIVINVYRHFGRLCYIVKYNDKKDPKSGVFYADMLLFSNIHSLAEHLDKGGELPKLSRNELEGLKRDELKTCKYCETSFDEIPESESETGACEYCVEKREMFSEIKMKKSVNVDLHEFSIFGQDGDWLEVTEWANGEGIDIILEYSKSPSKNISLSYDELEAIINIVNKLGTLPPIYTKNEIEK